MNTLDVIKLCADSAGIPQYMIGVRMGKTKHYIAQVMSRGSVPKADTLARMLDACGYGLFACPLDARPEHGYRITPGDE